MSELCLTSTGTPTAGIAMTGRTGLFRDWRGQFSWGRICSAVALVVAVVGQFRSTPMDTPHLAIWLGIALGNYGASKVTEMVTARRTVETGGEQ